MAPPTGARRALSVAVHGRGAGALPVSSRKRSAGASRTMVGGGEPGRSPLRIRPITRRLEAMKPCSACIHPDRVVIDAELQQRVSLRTVAGRHGLSTTAVHRHQTQHLDGAILGDVVGPDPVAFELGGYQGWARWAGSDWEDLGPVRPPDLVELRGRRLGGQRVYRFRRGRARS